MENDTQLAVLNATTETLPTETDAAQLALLRLDGYATSTWATNFNKNMLTIDFSASPSLLGGIGEEIKLQLNNVNVFKNEYTTQRMETSIQANGMVITKGKEKLTTRTELNIRDTGIEKMVVLRDMD